MLGLFKLNAAIQILRCLRKLVFPKCRHLMTLACLCLYMKCVLEKHRGTLRYEAPTFKTLDQIAPSKIWIIGKSHECINTRGKCSRMFKLMAKSVNIAAFHRGSPPGREI